LILFTYRILIKEVLAEDESSDNIKAKYPRGDLTAELRDMLFQLVYRVEEVCVGEERQSEILHKLFVGCWIEELANSHRTNS
jgi:hypothetical protein